MEKQEVVAGVQKQVEWWIGQRLKKIKEEDHGTMEVNPFMAPLISALHGHSDFIELAEFLLGGHFSIGHATGFGKLIDEKVLPNVFGTKKLDKAMRSQGIFRKSCFDNVDHVVNKNGKEILLSLKASKWTIQLGQAVELNKSFKEIRTLYEAAEHTFDELVIATFYGRPENLTDKYRLVRGISQGANHDVHDIQEFVTVYAGQEFWRWLGGADDTQYWVMEGIQSAISNKKKELDEAQALLATFRNSFAKRYAEYIDDHGVIDWVGILRAANGE